MKIGSWFLLATGLFIAGISLAQSVTSNPAMGCYPLGITINGTQTIPPSTPQQCADVVNADQLGMVLINEQVQVDTDNNALAQDNLSVKNTQAKIKALQRDYASINLQSKTSTDQANLTQAQGIQTQAMAGLNAQLNNTETGTSTSTGS